MMRTLGKRTLLLIGLALSGITPGWAQPATTAAQQPAAQAAPNPWIVGIGGGARIGIGEPTDGLVYGRLGHRLNQSLSLSLRPAYVFGNSDAKGRPNHEGAFQVPLTLDVQPDHWISPYIGAGIATNTDSSGSVDPMLSAGVDVRLAKHVNLVVGLNVVLQAADNNRRDLEGLSALVVRF